MDFNTLPKAIMEATPSWKFDMIKLILNSHSQKKAYRDISVYVNFQPTNSTYISFFNDTVEKVDNDKSYVSLPELYTAFKNWHEDRAIPQGVKKYIFFEKIKNLFEAGSWRDDTKIRGVKVNNCWKGYTIKK